MAENLSEVIAGGAVLAAAVGFLFYAGQTSGFTARTDGYALIASFRAIDGITVGSDVRLAGVKVGTITSITLNPVTFFADTMITMREDIILPEDSAILISSEGLLGGNYVEVIPGGSPINLEPGAEIEDTQGSVSLVSLLMKFVGAQSGDPTLPADESAPGNAPPVE
jgi:phospholipid/cholesterol/gamma-HCH transport system substrate-binding protein